MALTPVQIIETVCPELASSPSRDAFIQMAVETTDKGFFGKLYPYAIAYLACHSYSLFSTEGGGGGDSGAGKIASKSEGGVSVSYFDDSTNSAATASSTEYGRTKYGEMYLALRARIPRMNVNRA
jgi:hypothetical protein